MNNHFRIPKTFPMTLLTIRKSALFWQLLFLCLLPMRGGMANPNPEGKTKPAAAKPTPPPRKADATAKAVNAILLPVQALPYTGIIGDEAKAELYLTPGTEVIAGLGEPGVLPSEHITRYSNPDIEITQTFYATLAEAQKGFDDVVKRVQAERAIVTTPMVDLGGGYKALGYGILGNIRGMITWRQNVFIKLECHPKALPAEKMREVFDRYMAWLDESARDVLTCRDLRSWTSEDGRVIKAKLLAFDYDSATVDLQLGDGRKMLGISSEKFSHDDVIFMSKYGEIAEQGLPAKSAPEKPKPSKVDK
jgi:hypothetical protein